MEGSLSYLSAQQMYASPERVDIKDEDGGHIAVFPLVFLERGHVLSWHYILEVVHDVVEQAGDIYLPSRKPVRYSEDPVLTGVYVFLPLGQGGNTKFRPGPTMKSRFRHPRSEGSTDTMSNSKRSSTRQTHFRMSLLARDSTCLLTDADFEDCTASHIVPQSRPDVYAELTHSPSVYMFHPSMGLLLRDDVHHTFDKMEWSLYYDNGVYVVHYFTPKVEQQRELHGKRLTRERFRSRDHALPDPELLKWHYRQCVMARIRGFSCD